MGPLHKTIFIVMAVLTGLAQPAFAVGRASFDASKDPTTAIRRVIEMQLDAIRRDDAEAAFALAAPNIRRAFRDPDTFMALVMKDYMPMRQWEAATFLELHTYTDHCVQRVKLVSSKGEVAVANYAMVKAGIGEWVVAGVALEGQDQPKPKTKAKRPPD